MSTGITKPKRHELQNDLTAIAEIPERVGDITTIRLKELLVFIESEIQNRILNADAMVSANFGKYQYPKEYLHNRELDYWLERIFQFGFNHNHLKQLQEIIVSALNSKTQFDKDVFKNPSSQRFFEYVVKQLYNEDELNNASVSYFFHKLKHNEDSPFRITGTRYSFAEYYNKLVLKIDINAFKIITFGKTATLTNFEQIGFREKKERLFHEMLLQFER